jgi:hypothetical protein
VKECATFQADRNPMCEGKITRAEIGAARLHTVRYSFCSDYQTTGPLQILSAEFGFSKSIPFPENSARDSGRNGRVFK